VAVLKDGAILTFEKPREVQRFHYSGDMIAISNKQIDLLVTPDHRLYVRRPGKNWAFEKARDIADAKVRMEFKKNAIWDGTRVDSFTIDGIDEIPMNLWLEFMGYFISQGFVSSQNRVGIYGKYIEDSPIGECVRRLPIKFWIERNPITEVNSYRTKNLALYETLKSQGKSWNRFIPRTLLQLDTGQLRILFDALMYGNGRKGKTTWSYMTTSFRLASDLQELLLRLGMCGSIATRQMSLKGKNRRSIYDVCINRSRLTPQINKRRKSAYGERYDGDVHCCTVSSGILYVRRNGKCCWSGNSDRFWALALAIHAASTPAGPVEYETVSKRAFGDVKGAW
jgi:replicative DNA helicase Mcm